MYPVLGASLLGLQDVQLIQGRSLALLVLGNKVAGKTALRSVLGKLTARLPESLVFERTITGKPYLAASQGISFNVSHSRGHSLIALSLAAEVGCDIEDRFRQDDDPEQSGYFILHPSELRAMRELAPPERQLAFKRYWVRKEAALKATGSGFLRDPRTVIVGLDRAQPVWTAGDGPPVILHESQPAQDCYAAVASADPECLWFILET